MLDEISESAITATLNKCINGVCPSQDITANTHSKASHQPTDSETISKELSGEIEYSTTKEIEATTPDLEISSTKSS